MSESVSKTYKRGDTGPAVTVICKDGDVPVNLTGATSCKFLMGTINAQGNSTPKVNAAATFDADRSTGKVHYSWATNDLDTAGEFKAEVEVTWPAGKQTYPAADYLTIVVVADVA